jgi:hypothetical protein
LLRLLTDGGAENWSEGFILYLGYLVGVGIFDEIEWTRFPPKHSYNGVDAKFQPASVHFYGRRGGEKGLNTVTPDDFIEGLRQAYAKDKGTFLGGPPVQRQLDCTFDVVSYLKDYKEPEFHGWGHAVREFHGPQGEFRTGPKKSPIHFMHFYLAADGMVRMPYTREFPVWMWY